MKTPFDGLKPAPLWNYFYEITQVPRPSKKEGKILAYLIDFAKKNNLSYKQDKTLNVVISKAATPGMESCKKIVIQSHVDMVCEKNKETVHDFDNDPIHAYVDGDWVKARGTTLGADNGIGFATALALLTSQDVAHGPLDCLFTVDEETGLTGAHGLDPELLNGDILLNLDTEDEGVFTVGCAGGLDTVLTLSPAYENIPTSYEFYTLEVKGLNGGHSGVDINKGLANAIKILSTYIDSATQDLSLRVSSVAGGNLRNAIAREAHATVAVPSGSVEKFIASVKAHEASSRKEYEKTELGLKIECTKSNEDTKQCFTLDFQKSFFKALVTCPHGVLKMNSEITTLVETSTNLASIKNIDGKIVISTSQRSSVPEDMNKTCESVISAFAQTNAITTKSNNYPGWTPNFKSSTLELFKKSYFELFKKEPIVEVIHAGLECGLLGQKNPKIDMISFGPTITGPHSPAEKVQISSVEKYWTLLVEILKKTPRT